MSLQPFRRYDCGHRNWKINPVRDWRSTVQNWRFCQCWSMADLSTKALWPHHWRSSQFTLATSARAHPIQDRHTDIQGSAPHSATVPRTTRPSSRSAQSAGTPLCQLQSAVGHSTFLDFGSGMSCPQKLFRRRHVQVSSADLNPSSFSSHILILSSNCTFDTIVVLVVMFIT